MFSTFVLVLVCAAFVGALVYKYERIVSAKPGKLKTAVQPGELGRWVNPFIGTGGFPWVCGHNFPGAMVPFGAVRLGPETRSMLIHKRALNTSGYFYGDDELLGFSHTRLTGTGATECGHFLAMRSLQPIDARSLCGGRAVAFSHGEEIALPGYVADQFRRPRFGARHRFARSELEHRHQRRDQRG